MLKKVTDKILGQPPPCRCIPVEDCGGHSS